VIAAANVKYQAEKIAAENKLLFVAGGREERWTQGRFQADLTDFL